MARPGEAEALRSFARTHLAAYKVPKFVTIVDDYPRTAAGKVQKHVLRAIVTDVRGRKAEAQRVVRVCK